MQRRRTTDAAANAQSGTDEALSPDALEEVERAAYTTQIDYAAPLTIEFRQQVATLDAHATHCWLELVSAFVRHVGSVHANRTATQLLHIVSAQGATQEALLLHFFEDVAPLPHNRACVRFFLAKIAQAPPLEALLRENNYLVHFMHNHSTPQMNLINFIKHL